MAVFKISNVEYDFFFFEGGLEGGPRCVILTLALGTPTKAVVFGTL